jgi:hypothetical protein
VETECVINISRQEWEIANYEARAAVKKWGKQHVVYGGTHDKNSSIGYMCEIAVAKFLGVRFKLERDRTKNDADVAGYQVKGTAHEGGWMNTRDDMPTGIYIGCRTLGWQQVQILGWSTSRLMRRKMYWNDKPHMKRPCYSMTPEQMFDIETLPATAQLIKERLLIA